MIADGWDLEVDLSVVTPPFGEFQAILEKPQGGTYSGELEILPRFTFTKVGEPWNVRVYDTGLEGLPLFALQSDAPYSLVQPAETPLDVGPNVVCPTCPGTTNFWFGVDHVIGALDLFQFDGDGLTLSLRTTPIPTPGTLALLGVAGLMGPRRRRR